MATLSDFLSNMGDGSSVTFDKESDELLLEISKAFVDEEEASYYVNNDCLPYKKHGIGKQLRIDPYDSDFDQEDEGEVVMDGQEVNEIDNLLIEQPQRKHGIGKVLRAVREAYERAEKEGENKINGQKDVKAVKPLKDREQELKAKLEATKTKLRQNYQKTLPTRHIKVLDVPDLKRSNPCPKKPVPRQRTTQSVRARKRKLGEEARRVYKKIKTECRNRTLAI